MTQNNGSISSNGASSAIVPSVGMGKGGPLIPAGLPSLETGGEGDRGKGGGGGGGGCMV